MPDDKQWLNRGEAAEYLGVSLEKLRALLADGMLAYKHNPLDKREKLISIKDLEVLKSEGVPAEKLADHDKESEGA